MAMLRHLYSCLGLRANEGKSAVASAFGRKFLGYGFWLTAEGIRRVVASKAIQTFKQQIRKLTAHNTGRSLEQVIEGLRPYLLGWKAYFGLSQTTAMWKRLDGWDTQKAQGVKTQALETRQYDLPRTMPDGGFPLIWRRRLLLTVPDSGKTMPG